jgi:hypothetical protein
MPGNKYNTEQVMTAGSCLCKAVAFEVSGFSSGIYKCHCSKCRKAFGGASSAAVLVDEAAFQWLRGGDRVRLYETESGFKRYFCECCGCLLPQLVASLGLFWVPAGLFDEDPGVALATHIHVDSKAPWEVLDEQTPCLQEGFG